MTRLPHQLVSALAALKFQGSQREGLRKLDNAGWRELLAISNRMRLTILLRQNCADDLPPWVLSRIDQNIRDNSERFERLRDAYFEISAALQDVGAEHLVLKGFAQSPDFVKNPTLRMQGDLDLFCPPESIYPARDALATLGYQVVHGREHQPNDHLPAMMRKTDWKYKGNPFDPEIPLAVDLHFRFWNDITTRLKLTGLDHFWTRRVDRHEPFRFPALCTIDGFGYTALHVFHHLLVSGLTPYHVYELASFLDANAENNRFWTEWRNLHDDSLRRVEAVCFRLATSWFDCRISDQVRVEIDSLPGSVQKWFQRYANSPLESLMRKNKDSLWLHLSLLESARDKRLVFCSALLPVHVPPSEAVRQWSLQSYFKFVAYAVSRLAYHARKAPETIWKGFRWWCSTKHMRAPG